MKLSQRESYHTFFPLFAIVIALVIDAVLIFFLKGLGPNILKVYLLISSMAFIILYFIVYKRHYISRSTFLFSKLLYFLMVIIMIVGNFAGHFQLLEEIVPGSFKFAYHSSAVSVDFFYYSLVTFATVGYGDIVPVSITAKALTSLEILTGIISLIFIISNFQHVFGPARNENESKK